MNNITDYTQDLFANRIGGMAFGLKEEIFTTTLMFNFIQQKSPTFISGEMDASFLTIQWGGKPRLNAVKASGEPCDFY